MTKLIIHCLVVLVFIIGAVFAPLTKVDEAAHTIEGIATEEQPDRESELLDFDSSAPHFEEFFDERRRATNGQSYGPVRYMHQLDAVGKIIQYTIDDAKKQIRIVAKIVDPGVWEKIMASVLTGFSIGGRAVRKWADGDLTRFEATPVEVSVVDVPCLPTATFEIKKSDGTTQIRQFAPPAQEGDQIMKELLQTLADRHDDAATTFGQIAAMHAAKAEDINTSRADVKHHEGLAKAHEAMRKASTSISQACRKASAAASEKSATSNLTKEFFDQYVYANHDETGL